MNKPLFRKEALERLSSPDQLDTLITVTTTKGWLALVALGIILAALLLWGIFGSVSTRVGGEGILLFKQGVHSILAETTGRVVSVAVKEGERVAKGDLVATIYSESLEKKMEELDSRLHLRRAEYGRELEAERAAFQSFKEISQTQKRKLVADVGEGLAQKLANQEELYRKKLITQQTLQATRQAIFDAEMEVHRLDAAIKQRQAALEEKVRRAAMEIQTLEAELAREKSSAGKLTRISADRAGTVIKLETKVGALVGPGQRLAFLEGERRDGHLEESTHDAVVYVSAREGKRIRPGMEVQVVPGTVRAEEYGVMLGKVLSVSAFPVSYSAMLSVLENPELVQTLLRNGPLFEVWVDLLSDPRNPSGFRWSSPKGPPTVIHSGTMCTAKVVVKRQVPFSLVAPLLRGILLGREGE